MIRMLNTTPAIEMMNITAATTAAAAVKAARDTPTVRTSQR
jgi:hypothetical protein